VILLTAHELRVLELVSLGRTHQQIADELVMTTKGVTPTVNRAIRKLGATNAPHAVLLACRAGLLDGRPQRHGDHAGFVAHQRRREPPCDACTEGELDYQAERRDIRRQNNQQQEAAA
jgi:DNA-binding CsgD family transcriptional regulator